MNKDMLHSYASGPRIWDAASLVSEVAALAGAGLIEPVPDSAAYRLTDAGRAELREQDTEKILHDMINEVEDLARRVRVLSHGHLSLAFVDNHGKTLRERAGMSWTDAHNAAVKIFQDTRSSLDLESVAKEMFPVAYAAITDNHPMDPRLEAEVVAELARRKAAQ